MANHSVKLTVDVDKLQEITINNRLGSDNSWATIQEDNGPISTNPTAFQITVEEGDVITWSGVATRPSSGPQPVINITKIDFKGNGANFDNKKTQLPEGGESTYEVTAKTRMEAATYDIHFVISYLHRVLDPKIKVIPKPH